MRIEPTMDIQGLIERMYVNGDFGPLAESEARVLRNLLVQHAPAYQWADTRDVEDVDWFRMLHQAVAGA